MREQKRSKIKTLINDFSYITCIINNAAFVGINLQGWNVPFEDPSQIDGEDQVNLTTPFSFGSRIDPSF